MAGDGAGAVSEVPRRRSHALELVLAPDDDEAVRRRWARLEAQGVPSAARHPGATHRPHVTVASGPRPDDEVLDAAVRLLAPLLPVTLAVPGLALLGPPARATLAELVVPTADLRAAREHVVALWPGADTRPWLPHLTLAHRLAPPAVEAALTALDAEPPADSPRSRYAVALRWWDPDSSTTMALTGADPGPST